MGSTSSSARKKRDVPQLVQQAKQTTPPLQVGSSHGPTQAELDVARETGFNLSQLDPYAPDRFESAPVAFQYVKGGPMISPKLHTS